MMKHERGEDDVVFRFLPKGKGVALFEIDLGIIRAQAARDFQGRALLVDRVHPDARANFPGVIDDEPGDIARAGRQVEHSPLRPRPDPAPQEMRGQRVAPKMAIELAQVAQVAH